MTAPLAGSVLATLQRYGHADTRRCGTAGPSLVVGGPRRRAPWCNNCGRTFTKLGTPYQAWVRL